MKKSLMAGIIILSMVFCSGLAMATVYNFDVSYGALSSATLNGTVDPGSVNISDFNVTSTSPGITLDSRKATYCVDLFHSISAGNYSGTLRSITGFEKAAKIIEFFGASYSSNATDLEKQLQLSIWETLYETDSGTYNLVAGAFSSDYTAQGFADTSSASGPIDISNYRVLHFTNADGSELSTRRQDLLVKVASVPVPGAIWLLGSGLLGLVGIRRRRQD